MAPPPGSEPASAYPPPDPSAPGARPIQARPLSRGPSGRRPTTPALRRRPTACRRTPPERPTRRASAPLPTDRDLTDRPGLPGMGYPMMGMGMRRGMRPMGGAYLRRRGINTTVIGAVILVVGIVITVGTYSAASSSATGGGYYVPGGSSSSGSVDHPGIDDARTVDEAPLTRSEPPRRRTVRRARLLVAAPLAAVALISAAAMPAQADGPWWQLVAFSGQTVTRVAVVQGRVTALVGGGDGPDGQRIRRGCRAASGGPRDGDRRLAHLVHQRRRGGDGRRGRRGCPRDPGGPELGRAPISSPPPRRARLRGRGQRRRDGLAARPDGAWSVSLALLPATLITGTPAVTSIAGFNTVAASGVVYIGTAGTEPCSPRTAATTGCARIPGSLTTCSAWPRMPRAPLRPSGRAPARGSTCTASRRSRHPELLGRSLTGKWLITSPSPGGDRPGQRGPDRLVTTPG